MKPLPLLREVTGNADVAAILARILPTVTVVSGAFEVKDACLVSFCLGASTGFIVHRRSRMKKPVLEQMGEDASHDDLAVGTTEQVQHAALEHGDGRAISGATDGEAFLTVLIGHGRAYPDDLHSQGSEVRFGDGVYPLEHDGHAAAPRAGDDDRVVHAQRGRACLEAVDDR